MSPNELNATTIALSVKQIRLESEARNALDRNMHRIAYFKYRDVETLMTAAIDTLKETQIRERKLRERVRIGYRIDKIAGKRADLRKVIGLLWLHGRS